MIKAEELRIGNLIYGTSDRVETVTAIMSDMVIGRPAKLQSTFYHENGDINGIPLTEEWLVKLGFEKTDKDFGPPLWDGYAEWNLDGYRIMQDNSGAWFLLGYLWNTEHFKYVHQLQNLYFALTNQELTLNTPVRG